MEIPPDPSKVEAKKVIDRQSACHEIHLVLGRWINVKAPPPGRIQTATCPDGNSCFKGDYSFEKKIANLEKYSKVSEDILSYMSHQYHTPGHYNIW
jgi:hypothetical protein